jgi:hypothetical protein
MFKKIARPGDVHLDEHGDPVFYGAIDQEIAKEHKRFNEIF